MDFQFYFCILNLVNTITLGSLREFYLSSDNSHRLPNSATI